MPEMGLSFRITGASDAQGKVRQLSNQALQELREAARTRARQTVFRFKEEMAREYKSAWATGALASGVTFKTFLSGDGVEVKFYIQGRRELRYITAALGGHFQHFPVGPFVIMPTGKKALFIRFPNSLARQFIRGKKGQFQGSLGGGEEGEARGGILVKRVLWGRRTGGFKRDVISEVAQEESQLFVADMEAAVKNAIVRVTSS